MLSACNMVVVDLLAQNVFLLLFVWEGGRNGKENFATKLSINK